MTAAQLQPLAYWIAELAASQARCFAIRMDEHAPVQEPEAVEEFPEVEGLILI